ncbi:MAG: hypothetical protein KGS48_00915 [Bacteroidetes bacterium]|nr:hypothetical protein [Bacteroidota bacterium]
MLIIESPQMQEPKLSETPNLRRIWLQLANWTMVIVIMMLVYLVLTILNMLFLAPKLEADHPDSANSYLAFFLVVVLMGLPAWYGYQFVRLIRSGINQEDPALKTQAFRYFRLNYRFYGIINLIYLGILILLIVVAIFVIAASEAGTN